jgi:hypothetical protein
MTGFPGLPPGGGDPRQVAVIVNRMNRGKLNCTGEVTLKAGQPTTTVTDARASATSILLLMPLTASAAAAQAGGEMHVSARDNGSFTISHANTAQADRRFGYAIIG